MVAKSQYSAVRSKMALVVAVAILALLFTTAAASGEAVAEEKVPRRRATDVPIRPPPCATLEYASPDCGKNCRDDGYHGGGFVKNNICCCMN
ncbi:hypothetical protein EJB05_27262 [Eragrostis curvula]|uniref:Knottin scorpion toxin-like domain-containing protein n=1 Tax=Eragrostis curvula TaxID=38414 RepID=A0A5J9UM29_9POAL|nr:hypothetical protein EJB05_27262 [Eragrostis curvula]